MFKWNWAIFLILLTFVLIKFFTLRAVAKFKTGDYVVYNETNCIVYFSGHQLYRWSYKIRSLQGEDFGWVSESELKAGTVM